MTMRVLFLESIKPYTNRILYNEEMKENTCKYSMLFHENKKLVYLCRLKMNSSFFLLRTAYLNN